MAAADVGHLVLQTKWLEAGSIAKSVEFEFSYHNVPTFN